MNTMQVTSTGIAVAVAVVVAMGLLFFGPHLLTPFSRSTGLTASSTASTTDLSLTTSSSSTTQTTQATQTNSMTSSTPIPSPLPTTLTITDEVVGTGAEATAGKQITVNYTGMLPDGTIFDSSIPRGKPFTFTLGAGQVIKGWDQGFAGMKVGGKRRLIIPPGLAYGNQEVGGVIPANSTLIFDVELLDVK